MPDSRTVATDLCKNCGEPVKLINTLHRKQSWVHQQTGACLCHPHQVAEPVGDLHA